MKELRSNMTRGKQKKLYKQRKCQITHYNRNSRVQTKCGIGGNTGIQTTNIPKEEPLKSMKNRKTPGEDRITAEILKEEGETLNKAVHAINLLHKCLEESPIPEAWKKGEV